jgi:hypothetical protein
MPKLKELIQLNKNKACLFFPSALRKRICKNKSSEIKICPRLPHMPEYESFFLLRITVQKRCHLIFEPSQICHSSKSTVSTTE